MHLMYSLRCLWPVACLALASVGCAAGTTQVQQDRPLEAHWTFDDGAVRSDVSIRDLDLVVRAMARLEPNDSLIVFGTTTKGERTSLAMARAETLRHALVARGALQDRLHVTTGGTAEGARANVWIEVFSEEPMMALAELDAPAPPEATIAAAPTPQPEPEPRATAEPPPSLRTLPGGPAIPPPPGSMDTSGGAADAPVWPPPRIDQDEDDSQRKRKRKRRRTRRVRKGKLIIDTNVF